MALARVAMLCNRAEFKTGQENVPVLKRLVLSLPFALCPYNPSLLLPTGSATVMLPSPLC